MLVCGVPEIERKQEILETKTAGIAATVCIQNWCDKIQNKWALKKSFQCIWENVTIILYM